MPSALPTEAQSLAADKALYALDNAQAAQLAAMVAATGPDRVAFLASYLHEHGQAAFLQLLSEFMGLATSVVANCRELAEDLLTQEGMHPYDAEKINMPTLLGALAGVALANQVDPKGACHGCAFRLGSVANQSPSTTADVQWCQDDAQCFMCHARGVLPDGTPTIRCIGDRKAQRALVNTSRKP